MRTRTLGIVSAALLVLSLSTPLFGETLEEVEKKISDMQAKYKSIQIKSKHKQDLVTEDMTIKDEGETTAEYKRKGEKGYQARVESKSKGTRKLKDKEEEKTEMSTLMVHDGEYMYILTITPEQKSAMKQKPDAKSDLNPFDAAQLFKEQHKNFNIKLLPDETIEGKAVYAIETTPKKGDENPILGKSISYYDKKTGISVKTIAYNPQGKPYLTSITTEVKLDSDIPDSRFVFKAPEGVQVFDMTKAQQQEASEDKAADKPAETKEQPKAEEEKKTEAKEQPKEEPKKEEKKDKGVKGLLNKLK